MIYGYIYLIYPNNLVIFILISMLYTYIYVCYIYKHMTIYDFYMDISG